jgi:hypothetical protein
MPEQAPVIAPARRAYRGSVTNPARWADFAPRRGDVIVCTPAKCGTTWTQSIVAMLLAGGPDLPAPVPVLSPWIDADIGLPFAQVLEDLDRQPGRRVVKTHTPSDGFPRWEGVTVIAVYRHPLDVFFSLRKHTENQVSAAEDHPMKGTVSETFLRYLDRGGQDDAIDADGLPLLALHFSRTVLASPVPELALFHYDAMRRDPRAAVARLAAAIGVEPDEGLIDAVTAATSFEAMKDRAADFAPVAGTGFWRSDQAFFDSGGSRKWEGRLSEEELARYRERFAALVPDTAARAWIEEGRGDPRR